MFNLNNFLASPASTTFIVCITVVVALIFIAVVLMLWWTEIKQRKLKDFGRAVSRRFKNFFGKFSPNKPVKTVYSDKSRNYSGTEFLPIPAKAPTKEFTYEFIGWDKNYIDENGNVVARPIYIQKVNTLRVNVYDDDEVTLLKSVIVEYGAGVDLSDIKPTKPETKEFIYEFACWDKDIKAFYTNENVYAVYKAIPKKFTYTFFDSDGKTILSQTTAIYGTPILVPEPPVSNESDEQFAYWRGLEENMVLTKDESFVAVFKHGTNPNVVVPETDDVKKKQSVSSLAYDREERTKQTQKNKEEKTISPSVPKPSGAGVKVFNLAGAKKTSPTQNAGSEINLNSETNVKKSEVKTAGVQKLETKSDEEALDNITSNITVFGHKKAK